jgi:hypothetical protein
MGVLVPAVMFRMNPRRIRHEPGRRLRVIAVLIPLGGELVKVGRHPMMFGCLLVLFGGGARSHRSCTHKSEV